MILRFIYILIFVFSSILTGGNLYGQKPKVADVLDKATQFYTDQKEYRVDMKFTMYRGLSGANETESYTGVMERNGSFMRNSILNTKIYQFAKAKVIVDDETKTVTYVPVDADAIQNAPVDLKVFLDYFKESQILDKGDEWVCEMISTRKNFIEVPYGKVKLHISKKDYSITKQELFFSNRIPFKGKNGNDIEQDFGRMVIELSHTANTTIELSKMSDFIVNNGSNKMRLNESYAAYRFIDTTEENN